MEETTQKRARELTEELVEHIKHTLEEKTGITPKEVIKGGSLGQGTAVDGEFDLDLVIITTDITLDSLMPDRDSEPDFYRWVKKLKKYIKDTLDPLHCKIIRVTRHAVQFIYKDEINVDLLISPSVPDPFKFYQYLEHLTYKQQKSFTVCTSKWQVEFISDKPPEVKEFIRKAKKWRNKEWQDSNVMPPKSYLISLLVLKAFEEARNLNHGYTPHATSVTRQLQELVRGHHKLNVHWDSSNYIMTTSGLGPTVTLPPSCQGTRILDPANPFNNVYRSGVSNSSDTKDVETEWDLIVRRIDSLDLTEPDGIRRPLPRV